MPLPGGLVEHGERRRDFALGGQTLAVVFGRPGTLAECPGD